MKRLHLYGLPVFFLVLMLQQACGQTHQEKPGTSANPVQLEAPFQNIDVAAFKTKMKEANVVVLDVRTPAETANGKIEGAVEMDYKAPDFAEKVKALDKTKTYLVYCASGGRSAKTCSILAEGGFTNLYNLKGGYVAWGASGANE